MLNRIDWSTAIRLLMDDGRSQKEIGQAAGISQPVVSRLLTGKREEPSHSEGVALVDLFTTTFPGQPVPELATPTDSTPDSPPALAISAQGAMGCVAQGA